MLDHQVVMRLLVAERKRLGLTQAEVAKAMGVGQQAVSRYEAGEFLTFRNLAGYAHAVGYDLVMGVKPHADH